MNKKIGLTGTFLIITATIFAVGDYFGIFGVRENPEYALQEIKLRLSDKLDNSPIMGAKARCFQKGNGNACTQRDSGKLGVVSVLVPATRISTKTLLFERGHEYLRSKDPNIQIMLIHADFVNQVESIDINSHFNNPEKIYRVKMQPRGSAVTADE